MKHVVIKPLNEKQIELVNKLKTTLKELADANVEINYNQDNCCVQALNVETLDNFCPFDPTYEDLEMYGIEDPENYEDVSDQWDEMAEYICDINYDPTKNDFVVFAKSK